MGFIKDGAGVRVPAEGQGFVWFELPTGTEGWSTHAFFISLPRYGTKKEREEQGLKAVCGYMIFWGGVFSSLVVFTVTSFFLQRVSNQYCKG